MCPATTADICGTAFAKMSHRTLVTEPIILLGLATTVAEKLELAAAAPGRRVVLNPVEAWGSSRPKPEWLVVSLENYAAAALEGSEMASIFQEPALCAEDTSPDAISNLAEESSEKPPANTQEADSKFTKQTDQASTIGPEPLLAGVDTNGPWKGVLYGFWPALVLVLGMVVMLAILNARWALDGSLGFQELRGRTGGLFETCFRRRRNVSDLSKWRLIRTVVASARLESSGLLLWRLVPRPLFTCTALVRPTS
eukprot:s7177_g4.t1